MLKSALTMVLPVTATGHLQITGTQTGVPGPPVDTITIGSGFTVDYDVGGNLPSSSTLIVDGTLSIVSGGVLRANGADITVSSTGS